MAAQRRRATREVRGSWRRIIDENIAKALGNAFRQQILWILNERVASPSEVAKELGAGLTKVCNHIKVLKDAGCIELVCVKPVGNRLQSFYRATSRAFLDGADWPSVPDSVKEGMRATLLRNILDDAIEAVAEGTYDAHEGSHMSWTPMILDEQGREEMTQILEQALHAAIAVQESTKCRLISSGAPGISYTVSILGYPSFGGERTVGPPTDALELSDMKAPKAKKASRGKAGSKKAKATGKGSSGKATPKRKPKKRE